MSTKSSLRLPSDVQQGLSSCRIENARALSNPSASAIEAAGLRPRLVQGDATNLKVTYPLDLHLAEWILQYRQGQN